eukprot:scaffold3166_cov399-Prasinococcus_capsulatus_cf.AAC.4
MEIDGQRGGVIVGLQKRVHAAHFQTTGLYGEKHLCQLGLAEAILDFARIAFTPLAHDVHEATPAYQRVHALVVGRSIEPNEFLVHVGPRRRIAVGRNAPGVRVAKPLHLLRDSIFASVPCWDIRRPATLGAAVLEQRQLASGATIHELLRAVLRQKEVQHVLAQLAVE